MVTVNCRLLAPAIFAPVPLLVAVAVGPGVEVEPGIGVGVGVTEVLVPNPPIAK
jgi:hypothetical protein